MMIAHTSRRQRLFYRHLKERKISKSFLVIGTQLCSFLSLQKYIRFTLEGNNIVISDVL